MATISALTSRRNQRGLPETGHLPKTRSRLSLSRIKAKAKHLVQRTNKKHETPEVSRISRPWMTSTTLPITILTSTEDGYPQWEDANRQNTSQCPLYRLPNELMVAIMGRLELDDLYILHTTSRRFMELLSDPLFAAYHTAAKFPWWGIDDIWNYNIRRTYKSWCRIQKSWCCEWHCAIYFSARQKDLSVHDDTRICIGREGSVQLCSRLSVNWAELGLQPWGHGKDLRRCKMHLFDLDPSRPVTMQDLRRHLELRQAHPNEGGFALCPHFSWGDGKLLHAFLSHDMTGQ
ncbi:hypothetical protein B0T26DRAFT_681728 [Lasiosphaeria miniovina]|uniref:F-box domain-containing protein n=1 Tax=Lasiosphaeria miniovina TaxID=1954250 RepID=A0AA39ZQ27_9PEZI|nr:uncharacterized protein B0T26DRAFT_681728 [Lasiosphaeria miniovina]KAK0701597.1 hypothetical protein B0T26DRAFT_681728 [Lasiosphaeria miniovina]